MFATGWSINKITRNSEYSIRQPSYRQESVRNLILARIESASRKYRYRGHAKNCSTLGCRKETCNTWYIVPRTGGLVCVFMARKRDFWQMVFPTERNCITMSVFYTITISTGHLNVEIIGNYFVKRQRVRSRCLQVSVFFSTTERAASLTTVKLATIN